MSEQTSLRLPGLAELRPFLDGSPVATLVFGLPDQRVRLANEAVAELIGSPRSAIVGLRPAKVWAAGDGRQAQTALSALAVGALDSYRARRRLRTGAAPLAVAVWARHLQVVGGSVAVVIVVPEGEPKSAIRSVAEVLGPEAVDVAVGTLNRQWRIERVTPNSAVVLGRDQGELADVDLSSLVHPDDVGLLWGSVRDTAQPSEGALVRLRLHHATRGWVETRCLLFPLPEDERSPMAFVLAETGGGVSPASDADRIATLERHLLRFAAELHAGGWRKARPLAADASHSAALDELPRRQGEIVERLLRGERIPSIAASMYISASTVRNHLSRVFATFGVHSQSELLTLLRSRPGHVHPGEPAPHPDQ